MTPTFLTVARQGRNGWKRYLAGISLTLGTVMIIFGPILIITIRLLGLPLKEQSSTDIVLDGNLYRHLAFLSLGAASLILGLFLAVKKVHQRNFLTLISPNSSISWHRIFQGFSIFLILRLVGWLILYIILPERYIFIFQASLILGILLSFIVMPLWAFCSALFLSYLFQGLGLLIKNSLILSIVWGFLLGGIPSSTNLGYLTLIGILSFIFIAWIIIKDNRLELVIGLIIANNFFNLFLTSSNDTSNFPGFFRLADSAHPLPGFLSFIFVYGIFYYIFFGRKQRNLTTEA